MSLSCLSAFLPSFSWYEGRSPVSSLYAAGAPRLTSKSLCFAVTEAEVTSPCYLARCSPHRLIRGCLGDESSLFPCPFFPSMLSSHVNGSYQRDADLARPKGAACSVATGTHVAICELQARAGILPHGALCRSLLQAFGMCWLAVFIGLAVPKSQSSPLNNHERCELSVVSTGKPRQSSRPGASTPRTTPGNDGC